ncbi:hypothetical protein PH213_20600 [Streptomyces sp. SRF1]|uniref:hypothetical protein n=1 Tax=Streptomyces sp. SRF1 TaxID=1549642 RepID=UPI0025B279AF|nr:hypothetical protein [Streptomyces sp. SRF1]MDN3056907.1 hypothetical protein [Streptomyces sp. SRF1]
MTTHHTPPRTGGGRHPPALAGRERRAKARELARDYTAGSTIRGLVASYGCRSG